LLIGFPLRCFTCGGDFGMDLPLRQCSQIATTGGRRVVGFVMQVKSYVT
jgi:hypothetical protein